MLFRSVRLAALALLMLGLGLALAAWAPPAQAGTQDSPEITDPADDQEVCPGGTGVVPTEGELAGNGDILATWFSDTATDLHVFLLTSGDFTDGTFGPYTFNVHMTSGGSEVVATATTGDPPTAGGAATSATLVDTVLDLTVPKSAFADAAAGAELTALAVDSHEIGRAHV